MTKGSHRAIYVAGALLLLGGALCLYSLHGRDHRKTAVPGRAEHQQAAGEGAGIGGHTQLRGSGEPGSEPIHPQDTPAHEDRGWSCEVFGRVMGTPEAPGSAAARYSVAVTTEGGEPVAELPVEPDGGFSGSIPLAEPTAVLSCIARDRAGSGVSVLQRRRVTSGERVGLVFFLMEGALIRARVVDGGGLPVPGAAILLLERPVKRDPPPRTWEVESVLPVAQVLRCDEEGRRQIPVRPGQIWLRPLGHDGSWGAVAAFHVGLGETVDVGDLRLPGPTLPMRGRIVDSVSREPVEGAWVHLDGQVVRWRADGQPAASIHSDSDGVFVGPSVSPEVLPLRAAVGSPSHEATEVVFRGAERELVIELQPRPSLRIRLSQGGTELGVQGDEILSSTSWRVMNRQRRSSGAMGGSGTSSIYWIRDALLRTRTEVTPGPGPGEAQACPPSAGEYEVVMTLPGGGRSAVHVELARGERKTIQLDVPEALPTNLRFHMARGVEEGGLMPSFGLTWLAVDGEELAPAGQFDYATDDGPMDLTLWRPVAARGLRVVPRALEVSPFEEAVSVLDTSLGAVTDVHLRIKPGTALLEFQLAYEGQPAPLGGAMIWLVPGDTGAPGQFGTTFATDATGHALVRVPPGTYRALSLKRFGPAKWVDISVEADQTDRVLVPIGP